MLLTPIELLINSYIRLDPETVARLAQLSGKTLSVELRGLNITVYISPDNQGIHLKSHSETPPDTTINGKPFALLKLIKSGSHHITALSDDISVQGDLELAQQLQDIFKTIDIDWEEHLSRLIGDVAAHQMGNITRGTLEYGRKLFSTFRQTGTEYVQEELRYLPPREEVQDFINGIDETRDAVERLEARLCNIERRNHEGKSGS
jgi:ubiquinone biosynthesis accessory factor UbiJ